MGLSEEVRPATETPGIFEQLGDLRLGDGQRLDDLAWRCHDDEQLGAAEGVIGHILRDLLKESRLWRYTNPRAGRRGPSTILRWSSEHHPLPIGAASRIGFIAARRSGERPSKVILLGVTRRIP